MAKVHGRHDLPWQRRGAYETWISEVMLQQTQVQVVIPYYEQFIVRFPSVQILANAPLDDVLSHWADWDITREQGISIKPRELSSKTTKAKSREIWVHSESSPGRPLDRGSDIIPWLWIERVIQDGNVRRVLARLFAITGDLSKSKAQNELWSLADSLTPQTGEACRTHTQAMMDLGSIVCRRTRSDCPACPFQNRLPRLSTEQCCQIPSSKTDE